MSRMGHLMLFCIVFFAFKPLTIMSLRSMFLFFLLYFIAVLILFYKLCSNAKNII